MAEPCVLRRAVLKEELVALTGDPLSALILNRFLYWTRVAREYDKMLQEDADLDRLPGEEEIPFRHGWIYKTAAQLNEEIMMGKSPTTIRRALAPLVERGWVSERSNPYQPWDKTKQYRVNLTRLQRDLAALGYTLEGFALPVSAGPDLGSGRGQLERREECSTEQGAEPPAGYPQGVVDNTDAAAISRVRSDASSAQNEASSGRGGASRPTSGTSMGDSAVSTVQDEAAIPESTSKNTPENSNKEHTQKRESAAASGCASDAGFPWLFERFWKAYPRPTGKWKAFQAWQALLNRQLPQPISPGELVQAARNYALVCSGVEERYIMYPTTFLGEECRFFDFLPGNFRHSYPDYAPENPFRHLSDDNIGSTLLFMHPREITACLNELTPAELGPDSPAVALAEEELRACGFALVYTHGEYVAVEVGEEERDG